MVTSSELAELRQLLGRDPEQALGLLERLETRLREEEADFDGFCERLDRQAAGVLAADAGVLAALDRADAAAAALEAELDRDAEAVLTEAARTGAACGIVRKRAQLGAFAGGRVRPDSKMTQLRDFDGDRIPCPECDGRGERYCRTCDGIGEVDQLNKNAEPAKGGAS
jgi:hypothetical protein